MSSIDDIKFIAEIEYEIYKQNHIYLSHDDLVESIIEAIDSSILIKNLMNKEKELLRLIDDDE